MDERLCRRRQPSVLRSYRRSGSFSLKSLPPGTYTIEAWHEKLGTQTQTVTIGAKETKDIAFTFKAPAASTN
jgi:hypothetical protein